MMRLPSLEEIVRSSGRTFTRFPFVILNAAVGTAAALVIVDHEGLPVPTAMFKVLFAAILGISLLTGLTLVAEKRKWGRAAGSGVLLSGIALLAFYATTVPMDPGNSPDFHVIRLVMLAVAFHLFAAFAPFAARGEANGFWQYNKALCLRFITAALFSAVLFAGLAIALAALDNLFGIEVVPKRYFQLWVSIVGVFMTWFFLAGVPEDLERLDSETEYPKVLKVFAQYILLPLVLVYLVILYAYVGKILVEWSWPRGWVSGLIFGYGTTGILLLLLLHPIRDRAENVWIASASRWFYLTMVPLVVVLFLAMYRRISEYGFTEGRYAGMVLAGWLAVTTLYFLLSRAKNIKFIPATLCAVALAVSFGPWGAFAVSETSQVGRLRVFLEQNGILLDGKVRPAPGPVPSADQRQIGSIIAYLQGRHGYDRIQPWFGEGLTDDTSRAVTRARQPADVTKLMGIDYVAAWEGGDGGSINLNADRSAIFDIAGYDHFVPARYIPGPDTAENPLAGGVTFRVNAGLDTLTFISSSAGSPADSLAVPLRPLVDRLLGEYANLGARDVPPERMSTEAAGAGLKVKLCLRTLHLTRDDAGGVKLIGYDVVILYSTGPTP